VPTLYLDCPECERPVDVHTRRDGPTVLCPGCDTVIEVPKPGPRFAPAVVWAAAAGLVANPVVVGLVLISDHPASWVGLGVLASVALFLPPAVGLLYGKRWVWTAVLVLTGWLAAAGFAAVVPAFIYALNRGGWDWTVVLIGPIAAVPAGCVAGLLLLPRARDWCDR
jgi:uncharacterized paraquat-inducible protein A